MSLIPTPILDYSDKDFASLRLRLQRLARSVFPDWTDFNAANFGNLMLEMFAHVGDTLAYYQDAQAHEAFWPTVTRRISAIRLGRHINFTMPGAFPSGGTARFAIPAVRAYDIPIPPGTRMLSKDPVDPIPFRTMDLPATNPVTPVPKIPAGQLFVDVSIEQTEFISNELFDSTGAPNQEFILSRVPYVDGTANVRASDGDYTVIDSLVNVDASNPRRYVELVDQNNRAHIRFGNGVLGKIPAGTISVSYKITRGTAGDIEPNKLGQILDTIVDSSGATVSSIIVSNAVATGGGADRMSVAQARSLGPASLKALNRSITRSDFETHAKEVSGVARVLMLTSNEDIAVKENNGILLLVARGARLPSGRYQAAVAPQVLLDAVLTKITVEKPPTITFLPTVIAIGGTSAPFKSIAITARLHFTKEVVTAGLVAQSAVNEIVTALQDFFAASLDDGTANLDIDFGANLLNSEGVAIGEIAWSSIYETILNTSGVRKIDEGVDNLLLNNAHQSVVIGLREFPQLGRVTLINAINNVTLYDQIPV